MKRRDFMKKIITASVVLGIMLVIGAIWISAGPNLTNRFDEPDYYYEKFGFQPTIVYEGDWTPTDIEWYETLGEPINERIMVKGNADLRGSLFVVIPEYLWVEGDLHVDSLTDEIPETIHVGGELVLRGSRVKTLPAVLDVGEVNLGGTEVEELPEGFRLEEGWLTLSGSKVTRIPDGWEIRSIDARNSQLEYIGEHSADYRGPGILLLDGSKVEALPKDLHLISLSIGGTPIEVLPEGLEMEESLDLRGTSVRKLSERTVIHDELNLAGTSITELPPDLCVYWRLVITDTSIEIEDVPEGVVTIVK